MKTGIQMMIESMIGEQGMKAVEQCKQLLPSVPILIQNIQTEWTMMRADQAQMLRLHDAQLKLLERIATQNNLILGQLENLGYKVDPLKTTETPSSLMHLLSNENDAMMMENVVFEISSQGVSLCSICGALFCEHRKERQGVN